LGGNLIDIGVDFTQFAVGLDILSTLETAQLVGRETELEEMHRRLHGSSTRSTVVLHGLGGVGKTQLALAYAKRHIEKYTATFWLNANDELS